MDTEEDMATNDCSQDLRWQTNVLTWGAIETARQNHDGHPDSNVLSKRLALQRAFLKSSMSRGQHDGSCFDNDLDSGADRECSESADSPSVTGLNENTHSAVAKDVRAGAARNKTGGAGFKALSAGETQIALDLAGLTLSGSGMHLYLKADTIEKKRLLADAYLQLTAKPMKGKASRNLNVIKLLTVSSYNVETDDYFYKKSLQDDATYWKDIPRSSMSRGQHDGLCFDNDLDSGADREFSESADNPSIADLNENTNRAVAKDVRARNKSGKTGVKASSVGETGIQLDPVGISLSGSGMHLYVKADTNEKKKLITDTYLQLTAKPMKGKASRNRDVIQLSPFSSDNVETEGYSHKKSRQDDATYTKDIPRSSLSSGQDDDLCFDNDLDCGADMEFSESADNPSIAGLNNTIGVKHVRAGTARNKTGETGVKASSVAETEIQLNPVGVSMSSSGMHLYVKADTNKKRKFLTDTYLQLTAKPMKGKASRKLNVLNLLPLSSENVETEGYSYKKSRQDDATYSKDIPSCHAQRQETYAPMHTTLPARGKLNRQTGNNEIVPILDTFHSQEMVVKNNNYQQIQPHTADTLKRPNTEEIEANHQEKRSRYADLQGYRKQQQIILLHNQNHSRNNDDDIAFTTGIENGKHATSLRLGNDNNHGTFVGNDKLSCNSASTQTVTEPAHSGLTNQVPSTLFPDSTCFSSTANGGVSMSNLVEYAESLRKDVKEDYRNFNKLMKEFSNTMEERNNDSGSQSEPVQPKKDRKTTRSSYFCVIM